MQTRQISGLGIDRIDQACERLPIYVIPLKDLVKHTPDDNSGLNNIKGSLNALDKGCAANESMGKVLNNLRIAELE